MPDSGNPSADKNPSRAAGKPSLSDQHWRATLPFRKKDDLEKDLLEAVEQGNDWRFNILLQSPASLQHVDVALRAAIEHNRPVMFEKLSSRDTSWKDNYTFGQLAATVAEKGSVELMKLFVEKHGFDIHHYSDEPLRTAASHGHLALVEYLLSKGADHSAWNGDPLKNAADGGHLDVVKKLIEAGADVAAHGGDALERAARGNHVAVGEYLISKGAKIDDGNHGPLIEAARYGHAEFIQMLLDKGEKADARDSEAFSTAADNQHLKVAKLLLKNGADVDAGNGRALRLAAFNGDMDRLRFLLDAGADPNRVSQYPRETALTEAARMGRKDAVLLLMEHGADWRQLDGEALRNARRSKNREIVRAIIDGARKGVERTQGHKRLEFAETFGKEYSLDDLRSKRGPSGDTGLVMAAGSGVFAQLVKGAKGGDNPYLLPADLFNPDDRYDTVMTVLWKNKSLQQFFDPAFWQGRTGQVTEAYGLMPPQMQKRVQFDSIAADINRNEIMKRAKDANLQLKPKKPGL
jgi:ankyrin repeat protein